MKFLEKDLEEIIYEQLQSDEGCDLLVKRGFYPGYPDKIMRQLRIGAYGVADIVTYRKADFRPHRIEVIELKKDKISLSAFMQGIRYCKGIQRFFAKKGYALNIELTLIGSELDLNSDLCFLPDLINSKNLSVPEESFKPNQFDLNLYTYSYGMEGLSFENHENYSITQEGF